MAIAGKGGRPVGLPKTGGRQRGTPNKATRAVAEKLEALGCDPILGMARIAMDEKNSAETRGRYYGELAQYVHAKRKPIDDSDGEVASVNVAKITPEEAVDLARELISVFGARVTPRRELSAPVIEGDPSTSPDENSDDE